MNERLILITIAGGEHDAATAQIAAGTLPRLAALAAGGVSGPLRPTAPAGLAAWATLATGRHPEAHGIVLDSEPWAGGLRPVGRASWRAAPFWQRLSDAGVATAGVNWPASAPGAAWRGTHVDRRVAIPGGATWDEWALAPDVAPPALREDVRAVRVHVDDIVREMVLPFVPTLVEAGIVGDRAALPVAAALARLATVQAVAGVLAATPGWGLLAVHHDTPAIGGDLPLPAPAWPLIDGAIGALVDAAPAGTTIVVATAGQALRPGTLVAAGPGIAPGTVVGATILDIAPTIYARFGLGDPALPGRALFGFRGTPTLLPRDVPPAPVAADAADLARVAAFGHRPPAVPPRWQAQRLLAEASLAIDRALPHAADLAARAVAIDGDRPEALAILALAAVAARDAEGLRSLADRFDALAPAHPWAALVRAAHHALRGDARAAEPLLRRVEETGGRAEHLRVAQGWTMLRRPAEAARLYAGILAGSPDDTAALVGLARALSARPLDAEPPLRRALAIDPFNRSARALLATLLRRTGRTAEAAAIVRVQARVSGSAQATRLAAAGHHRISPSRR